MIGAGLIAKAASTLTGWGVAEKFSRPLVWLGIVVCVLGLLGVGKCTYDSNLIEKHDAEINLKVEGAAREADGVAAGERRDDDSRAAAEAGELEEVIDNDPEKNDPVSDAERDYLRCIGMQQRAREAGTPAPTCSRPAD